MTLPEQVAEEAPRGYADEGAAHSCAHSYLLPALDRLLREAAGGLPVKRVFDLGCGNGSVGAHLSQQGWDVVGVDPSEEGIAQAKRTYPALNLSLSNAFDDLATVYGRFPIVYSLEVVEHVFYPRKYAATLFSLLEPGGMAIVSTPYHSYFKNLVLALTGKMDQHFTALWDYGHIKFWSIATLSLLLRDAGFTEIGSLRVGRFPALAKSMILTARKPGA